MVERASTNKALDSSDFDSGQNKQIQPIHFEDVIDRLELRGLSKTLLNSVRGSLWGTLGNGDMIIECRILSVLQQPRDGAVTICDFDDCLMSATGWHRQEYQLIEQNEALHEMGINITSDRARDIYELSKIRIQGLAEKEARYTPRLNLILLGIYAEALKEGQPKEQPEEQAWNELLDWRQTINQQVQALGERALKAYAINPLIMETFIGNHPANFLYGEFIQDVLAGTRPNDIRIIATRGKIEGPLGQIYKVHESGLMKQKTWAGQRIDLVIYSNDVKAEALVTLTEVLPDIQDRLIRVYDDNPSEVLPYLEVAKRLGTQNIEVVQVSHPDAKRKDANLGIEPRLVYFRGKTRLRHYSPMRSVDNLPPLVVAQS